MGKVITTNAPVAAFYGEPAITTVQNKRVGITIPPGVKSCMVNNSGDWRIQLAPPVVLCCKTTDNEVTFTDYTSEATDKSAATDVTLSSLNTAANGDYWYVACKYKFGGVYIDVDGANSNASTMTGYYYTSAGWANITITDGTLSSTVCLAVDGAVTWTVPTLWKSFYLSDIFPGGTITNLPLVAQKSPLYIVRFQVSAALDSAVTLDGLTALGDIGNYPQGYCDADVDYTFNIDREKTGAIEYYDTTGSKTLHVTFLKENATDQ